MVLRKEITSKIRDLLKQNPQGLNITAIVRGININRNTAGRYLENLMVSGQVEMRRFGMAKIYRLAKRVPLSAMLSISSELILLLDSGMRVVYANDPLLQFCGTTQKDLYGKNIEYTPVATVFDDAFDTVKKQVRAGLKGAEWAGELSLTNKAVIFSCRIKPAVFEEGQRGVSLILEDITERKKAERALRESEERYRSLAEASQDLIFTIDRDDMVTYVNSFAAAMLRRDPAAIIGMDRASLFPRELADRQTTELRRVFESGMPFRSDGPMAVNGEIRWFDHFLMPVVNSSGRVDSVLGVSRDITEKREGEEALRESEATARALINAPTDSVFLLDLQGVILDLNETAAARIGRRKDELIGVVGDTVLPEKVVRARRQMIFQVIGTKKAIRFVDERDGIWYDTVAYPIFSEGGEVNKIAIIARDISDRQRIEEALRQSEGKLHAMLQSITDPMTMMDESLTIIWANDAAQRCFGAGIVGMKCYEAFHQRLSPCEPSPCLTLRAFADGKMHRHETTVIDREGTRRFFDCTANVALRDEQGRPAAVLEISRDCTGLKRAEAALHKGPGEIRETGAPGTGTKKAPSMN
jgi:PAS domain S-box-containing protein